MKKIAESHGYKKTQDCYWVQIFEDSNGNHIVMTREDGELLSNPCDRLEAMLNETASQESHEATEDAKEEPKNENREYCKRIALELEAYVNGHMYQDENGETVYSKEDRDDLDQLYLGDYMSTEVLDFDIVIGGDWEYKSCKLYVTLGGPNVWIDTAEKAVKLAWGTDREEYPIDWDVCDEIDQYWAETYECARGGR